MPRHNKQKNRTQKIALGGVLSAASVAVLFLGGIFPLSTFMAPILAGLMLLPVFIECGTRIAVVAYFAVSALALLFVPDREVSLLFVVLAGYYPILQPVFFKINSIILRYIVKLVYFNLAAVATYAVLLYIFVSPAVQQEFASSTPILLLLFAVIANITFILYDMLIDRLRIIYHYRIHNRFFR